MKVVFYITVVCLPTSTKRMCTPYIRAEFFLVLAQTIYSNYTYWSRAALGTPCWCGDRPRTSRCRGPPSSCLQPGKKHILFYWSRLRRTVNIFQWINALKAMFFLYPLYLGSVFGIRIPHTVLGRKRLIQDILDSFLLLVANKWTLTVSLPLDRQSRVRFSARNGRSDRPPHSEFKWKQCPILSLQYT